MAYLGETGHRGWGKKEAKVKQCKTCLNSKQQENQVGGEWVPPRGYPLSQSNEWISAHATWVFFLADFPQTRCNAFCGLRLSTCLLLIPWKFTALKGQFNLKRFPLLPQNLSKHNNIIIISGISKVFMWLSIDYSCFSLRNSVQIINHPSND